MRLLIVLILIFLTSCAHIIAPKTVERTNVYSDSTYIISKNPDGSRNVTQAFVDRYNALIDLYGDQFVPPLKHNDGINPFVGKPYGTIDPQHYIKALQMSQWQRDGRQPTGTIKRLLNKF